MLRNMLPKGEGGDIDTHTLTTGLCIEFLLLWGGGEPNCTHTDTHSGYLNNIAH